jgi:hypothetical protein
VKIAEYTHVGERWHIFTIKVVQVSATRVSKNAHELQTPDDFQAQASFHITSTTKESTIANATTATLARVPKILPNRTNYEHFNNRKCRNHAANCSRHQHHNCPTKNARVTHDYQHSVENDPRSGLNQLIYLQSCYKRS